MRAKVNGELTIKSGDKTTVIRLEDKTLSDWIDARLFARKLAKSIRQAAKS